MTTGRKAKYEQKLEEYAKKTDEKIAGFLTPANEVLDQLKEASAALTKNAADASTHLVNIRVAEKEILDFHKRLTEGDDEYDCINEDILASQQKADEVYNKVVDTEKELYGSSKEELTEITEAIANTLDAKLVVRKDSKVYQKKEIPIKGTIQRIKDIEGEIAKIRSSLKVEKDEAIRNFQESANEIITRMEKLLPDMTASGLSAAFERNRKHHAAKERVLQAIFYLVILIMVAIPFAHGFVFKGELSFQNTSDFLLYFLRLLPFEFPLVWLAWFISRRVKQEARLHEEYQHKWAVAYSYEGLRREASDLDTDDRNHSSEVFSSFIESYSLNPSNVINTSDENMPYERALKFLVSPLKRTKESE